MEGRARVAGRERENKLAASPPVPEHREAERSHLNPTLMSCRWGASELPTLPQPRCVRRRHGAVSLGSPWTAAQPCAMSGRQQVHLDQCACQRCLRARRQTGGNVRYVAKRWPSLGFLICLGSLGRENIWRVRETRVQTEVSPTQCLLAARLPGPPDLPGGPSSSLRHLGQVWVGFRERQGRPQLWDPGLGGAGARGPASTNTPAREARGATRVAAAGRVSSGCRKRPRCPPAEHNHFLPISTSLSCFSNNTPPMVVPDVWDTCQSAGRVETGPCRVVLPHGV